MEIWWMPVAGEGRFMLELNRRASLEGLRETRFNHPNEQWRR